MTLMTWLRRWLIPPRGNDDDDLPQPSSSSASFEHMLQESKALRERTMYEREHRERVLRSLEARARFRSGGQPNDDKR